jgi:hypothetical protein
LKKIAEKNLNLENTYKEQKEDREPREKKPYQKKEFKPREYKPRNYEKKEEEEQVDSDGFTLVSSEKKKKSYNPEDRPYKKQYRDNKDYKEKKFFVKRNQGDKEEGEGKEETKEVNVEKVEEKTEVVTSEAVKPVSDKVVVKISSGAKKLKDLF